MTSFATPWHSACPNRANELLGRLSVVEKTEVFEAASNLIARFGEKAAAEAERRARELRREGTREAYLFWLEVLDQTRSLIEQRASGKQH